MACDDIPRLAEFHLPPLPTLLADGVAPRPHISDLDAADEAEKLEAEARGRAPGDEEEDEEEKAWYVEGVWLDLEVVVPLTYSME